MIRPAYGQSPVRTAIDAGVQATILASRQDNRSLAHIGLHKVPRVFDLGLMAQEQPATAKYASFFEFIDRRIRPASAAHQIGAITDKFRYLQ
jgi:hypothetical protein